MDQIREDARAMLAKPGKSQAWMSRKMGKGYSQAVLSAWFNGAQTPRDEEITRRVNNLIELDAATAAGSRPVVCVETNVAREIWTVCYHASVQGSMGEVIGPAGVGKTIALRACEHKFVGSVYLRCDQGCRSPGALLRTICRRLGLGVKGTIDTLLFRVVDRLDGTDRMLLFDEAQKLNPDALDVVRDIHDQAHVPIVLGGTFDLHKLVDDSTVFFGQMSSRISVRLNISERHGSAGRSGGRGKGGCKPLFTVDDVVRALDLESSPLRLTTDARSYLTDLACAAGLGSLRLCSQLIRALESMPGLRGRQVTDKTIRKALKEFHGIEIRDRMSMRIEQTRTRKTA